MDDTMIFDIGKKGSFDLRAVVSEELDGLDLHTDRYGGFGSEPESPYAIRHEPDDPNTFDWYNPPEHVSSSEEAEELYQKVLGYGVEWGLFCVHVEALFEHRALGCSYTLGGIEARDHTEAFDRVLEGGYLDDLIDEAVEEAWGFAEALCKKVRRKEVDNA